jgi:hypothetical protein
MAILMAITESPLIHHKIPLEAYSPEFVADHCSCIDRVDCLRKVSTSVNVPESASCADSEPPTVTKDTSNALNFYVHAQCKDTCLHAERQHKLKAFVVVFQSHSRAGSHLQPCELVTMRGI